MKFLFFLLVFSFSIFSQETNKNKLPVDTSFTVYNTYQKEVKNYPFIKIVEPEIPGNVRLKENIVYKVYSNRQLHLDLFLPVNNNSNSLPAVILIHGGGWRSGNKSMEHPMAAKLASKGYVSAAVEYRLSPEAKYPAGIYDLKEAVKWLKKNASEYNIDTNKIAALGTSAGGTLAALLGTTGGVPEFEEGDKMEYKSNIHAIVDIDGILDFTHPAESGKDTVPGKPSAGKAWFGASYKENPDIWKKASPLTYAGKNTPPIIFINSSHERFHAGRDEFLEKIKSYNTYFEIHTIPDTPHPFWLFHPWFEPTLEHVISFLDNIFMSKK